VGCKSLPIREELTVDHINTVVDLLRWRAQERGPALAYTWLEDRDDRETHLTYAQLDLKARALAAHLQALTRPGARALLVYSNGLDYLTAFFGCLYAGVIAVPVYPPRLNRSLDRLEAVVKDAGAVLALTTAAVLGQIEGRRGDTTFLQSLSWLATDSIEEEEAGAWKTPELTSSNLAFLQYTSGSTGTPKGVMISHGNLLANQRMIQESFGHNTPFNAVGWLPLYHDMGLIGNALQPLYVGGKLVQMSPVSFLQKPRRWLEAISRYRATTSGAPNFAYDLCVRRISPEVIGALDLSCWRVAYVGAEPIRAATLERFAETFGPCGFRRTAFLCCYGMAEATLLVTGSQPSRTLAVEPEVLKVSRALPASCQTTAVQFLVGSGRAAKGTQIVIADPKTRKRLPPGRIGEIWIGGAQVALGYWGKKETTRETFHGRLADTGEGPLLRSGDLGFLHQGELFVTGRIKDLIIVDGRNHYPQDIEWTVECSHSALRPNGGAAFAVEHSGAERLVVVQEVERQALKSSHQEIVAAIRRAVAEEHDVAVFDIQLLRPGGVPKTSSGKTQRSLCRQLYLSGSLDLASADQSREAECKIVSGCKA
jgi:acyl-CoA synthetase (AMP-forming)/AMP-acid ligase II